MANLKALPRLVSSISSLASSLARPTAKRNQQCHHVRTSVQLAGLHSVQVPGRAHARSGSASEAPRWIAAGTQLLMKEGKCSIRSTAGIFSSRSLLAMRGSKQPQALLPQVMGHRTFQTQLLWRHSLRVASGPLPEGTRFFSGGWRQAGQNRAGSTWVRQLAIFFLAATGFVVWAAQIGEFALYYWFPDRYHEMVKYELEDEKRREQFYGVNPLLPDELYFEELQAKDIALQLLSDRILRHPDVAAAVGSEGPGITITYLNAKASDEIATHGAWAAGFYLQGLRGAAVGEATFEPGGGSEWIPVAVKLRRVEPAAGEPVLEAAQPLPHGLKYSNLNLGASEPA